MDRLGRAVARDHNECELFPKIDEFLFEKPHGVFFLDTNKLILDKFIRLSAHDI
jgi:hypothetical protein